MADFSPLRPNLEAPVEFDRLAQRIDFNAHSGLCVLFFGLILTVSCSLSMSYSVLLVSLRRVRQCGQRIYARKS